MTSVGHVPYQLNNVQTNTHIFIVRSAQKNQVRIFEEIFQLSAILYISNFVHP